MKGILLLGIAILTGLVVLWLFSLLETHFFIKKPISSRIVTSERTQKTLHTTLSPSPVQPTENCAQFPLANGCGVIGAPINICSKQYPNYPPITDILTTKTNTNLGVYTGVITTVNTGLHAITITSISGMSFVFEGGVNGKIYDIHSIPVYNISLVPIGVKALVSFPCNQKYGYFTLDRFQMVQ